MPAPADPYDLARFVDAQQRDYAAALAELRAGAKRTHWIWYVFPQLRGLGTSEMARRYGITGLDEARAYLAHPVLGSRLLEAAEAVVSCGETDPHRLFGSPDDMKVRSSLTLFIAADPGADVLVQALDGLYGTPDPRTLDLLGLSSLGGSARPDRPEAPSGVA